MVWGVCFETAMGIAMGVVGNEVFQSSHQFLLGSLSVERLLIRGIGVHLTLSRTDMWRSQ